MSDQIQNKEIENELENSPPIDSVESDEIKKKRRWRPTRRGFLIGAGATGAALALGIPLGKPYVHLYMAEMIDSGEGGTFGASTSEPNLWFEVADDSRIQLFIPQVEMGQGVHTSITQSAADELDVDWDVIEVVQAGTDNGPFETITGGSTSVSGTFIPLRTAAATLKYLFLIEAARMLDQPMDALQISGRGVALVSDVATRVDFAELAANESMWEVPEDEIALKDPSEFRYIGKPVKRVDIPAKVNGQAVYGYDARLPGMLYGAIARPPTLDAKMVDAQKLDAESMPGVKAIIIDIEDGFVGVAATSRAKARAAIAAMQIDWDEGRLWQQTDVDAMVVPEGDGGTDIQRLGNVEQALENSNTIFSADYRTPFAVHTPLEPQAALADLSGDKLHVWITTQDAGGTRTTLAEALGLEKENITVSPTYVGGGFGRKLGTPGAIAAARLSREAGVPVHIGWDRPEAMRYGYFRPPTHSKLQAALDSSGRIAAWDHKQGSGNVAYDFLPKFLSAVMGSDLGAWRGARINYEVPDNRTTAWRKTLPARTGWWRALGLLANTFAVESFVDELAHAAAADPLQFRLDHMPDNEWGQRMGAVLQAAADKADWGGPLPAGHARGIACNTDVGTVVAQVAEISLDEQSGKITVHKITCAMECGRTINPDGAAAQVEGSVMWGVGSTLIEQMQIKDGQVDLDNFNTYPLLTMKEAPDVETILLEGDGTPRGVGEPPMGPVAAAIGNALFTLTGTRVRDLPMTPERVLDALA